MNPEYIWGTITHESKIQVLAKPHMRSLCYNQNIDINILLVSFAVQVFNKLIFLFFIWSLHFCVVYICIYRKRCCVSTDLINVHTEWKGFKNILYVQEAQRAEYNAISSSFTWGKCATLIQLLPSWTTIIYFPGMMLAFEADIILFLKITWVHNCMGKAQINIPTWFFNVLIAQMCTCVHDTKKHGILSFHKPGPWTLNMDLYNEQGVTNTRFLWLHLNTGQCMAL